jgi:hypothetical protein
MAQRRRRHLRRDALVFAGSLVLHIGLFFLAAAEFNFYSLPQESESAVQVQIVPPLDQPIPPPPPLPPIPKPTVAPTPQTPAPTPTPSAQPQPKPQPPQPQPSPTPQPIAKPTAPARAAPTPTPTPAKPALAPAPSPLPTPAPAPQPGPPKAVSRASVSTPQSRAAVEAPHIVLHKSKDQGGPLAPSLNLPGATFAQPQQAAAPPGGGAPGGGPGANGLPSGPLPGFGLGLRGGPLGCANAEALHLTREEQARCDEAFGAGARESPRMDAIGSAKRGQFDSEAAAQDAAHKYRDSTPAGSDVRPEAGQPHDGALVPAGH